MISSSLKNSLLTLALSALIASVEAQATCTSTSPQCCWVVQSWISMGQSSIKKSKSSSDPLNCCGKNGVTCDSSNKVIKIDWSGKKAAVLPSSLENLKNLKEL